MRMRLLTFMALAVCGALMAALGPIGRIADTATGAGGITFGNGGHGRGFFDFAVAGGLGTHGRILFGAENPSSYPEIVIRVNEVIKVDILRNTVRITARGHFQNTPVDVVVVARDNAGTGDPDEFSVETFARNGDGGDHDHFYASGKLTHGDIQVGPLE